uniref:E3 ubiquitin-protein ligase SINA-like 2 n=1 Tax=Erigeron canadensis TaxID=72917 RepID=UPI001CB8CE73|nr:E3 ubiquitin-protein ligase SINA-like 2 [Erigeron canadensis]
MYPFADRGWVMDKLYSSWYPCSEPAIPCVNGHITCSSCCSKVKSKCPFCCMPIGMSRCRGLEKLIGSIFISCKYAKNGCELRTPYSNKNGHEQLCSYVTCFCPQPSCSITCSPKSLYLHFVSAHAQSTTLFTYNTTFPVSIEMNQKQMFLQEQDKGVVFVLINHEVQHGRAFYLVCIGLSILKTKFVYQLTAEATDTTLSLNSVPAVYTSLSKDTPIKNYLTIPSEFAGSDGLLSLSLSINKVSELDVEVIQPWDYDPDADKVLKVVLTDPDIFDCSICLTPLFTPIFQCENGHLACSLCCSMLKSKCSSCCFIEPISKISCRNAKNGCKKALRYSKKSKHEQKCPHATCYCPYPSCPFAGCYENLYLHFGIRHAAFITRFTYNTTFSICVDINQKHIYLQEQKGTAIFILTHEVREDGLYFYIDCVGTSAMKNKYVYQLEANSMEPCCSLKSVPEVHSKWSEHSHREIYLKVPFELVGYNGILSLSICITEGFEVEEWIFFRDD